MSSTTTKSRPLRSRLPKFFLKKSASNRSKTEDSVDSAETVNTVVQVNNSKTGAPSPNLAKRQKDLVNKGRRDSLSKQSEASSSRTTMIMSKTAKVRDSSNTSEKAKDGFKVSNISLIFRYVNMISRRGVIFQVDPNMSATNSKSDFWYGGERNQKPDHHHHHQNVLPPSVTSKMTSRARPHSAKVIHQPAQNNQIVQHNKDPELHLNHSHFAKDKHNRPVVERGLVQQRAKVNLVHL